MDGAFPSKAVLKRAMDSMFEPNPDFHKFIKELNRRKEVRKKMAIDYGKEWQKLRKSTGYCTVIKNGATTLDIIMDTQIRKTIDERELLMEEYMKETILTEISGGDKHYHHIKITDSKARGPGPIGTMYIHKEDFDAWCKKKERR